jgi:hypothetical protein
MGYRTETGGNYIVQSKSLGPCQNDTRAYDYLRVCLDERPGYSYWLYSVTDMKHGQIGGLPGIKHIVSEGFHGIKAEDIVRSSLYVHENNIPDNLPAEEFPILGGERHKGYENAGPVPGAFKIPVCNSPDGDAISSVWTKNRGGHVSHTLIPLLLYCKVVLFALLPCLISTRRVKTSLVYVAIISSGTND